MQFVLVDRFLEMEPGRRAVATKRFEVGDDTWADHFPGRPIVPGTLLVEAMGQTGGWLLAASLGPGRWPLLTMIESAKFRRLVVPGETLRLTAEMEETRGDGFRVRTTADAGDTRVADARLVFHAFSFDLPPGDAARFAAWSEATLSRLGLAPAGT